MKADAGKMPRDISGREPERGGEDDAADGKPQQRVTEGTVQFEVARPHRKGEHQQQVDPGADRRGEREANLGERSHQQQLQCHVHGKPGERGLDRRRRVLRE